MDISGKHRQILSTDESVQIYHYGGLYLYIIREDSPLFTYAPLTEALLQVLQSKEGQKIKDYVHSRFLAYQKSQPKWMKDHLAKRKK